MGYEVDMAAALTAFTAAGSFIFALFMETKDIMQGNRSMRNGSAKTA